MQPLMDNLEAQTYETFEKDSIKYIQVAYSSPEIWKKSFIVNFENSVLVATFLVLFKDFNSHWDCLNVHFWQCI